MRGRYLASKNQLFGWHSTGKPSTPGRPTYAGYLRSGEIFGRPPRAGSVRTTEEMRRPTIKPPAPGRSAGSTWTSTPTQAEISQQRPSGAVAVAVVVQAHAAKGSTQKQARRRSRIDFPPSRKAVAVAVARVPALRLHPAWPGAFSCPRQGNYTAGAGEPPTGGQVERVAALGAKERGKGVAEG